MLRNIFASVVGTVLSLSLLTGWFVSSPRPGAGWLLAAAILVGWGAISAGRSALLSAAAAAVLTAGFGYAWFTGSHLPHVGWTLAAAILSAISCLNALSASTSSKRQTEDPSTDDSKRD